MTRIPKLYETAAEAREPNVTANLEPLQEARAEAREEVTGRRRKLLITAAAILLSPIVVKGAIDSYGYGYHGTTNVPAQSADQGNN